MRERRLALLKRRLLQGVVLCVLVGVTFVFARGAVRMYERYSAARTAEQSAKADVDLLKERESELQAKTQKLSSDRGVEEALRERYGVVREGEQVIEILEPADLGPASPAENGVLRWFRGLF